MVCGIQFFQDGLGGGGDDGAGAEDGGGAVGAEEVVILRRDDPAHDEHDVLAAEFFEFVAQLGRRVLCPPASELMPTT